MGKTKQITYTYMDMRPAAIAPRDALMGRSWGRRRWGLQAADHHFSGFDQGNGLLAGPEGEFADGIGGDDGGDTLIADRKDDLGEQTFDSDFKNSTEELVSTADAGGAGLRRRGAGGSEGSNRQELGESFERDAVMSSRSFDGADAAGENPVLEGRVADADFAGCLARSEQGGRGHGLIVVFPREYFTRFRCPEWEES